MQHAPQIRLTTSPGTPLERLPIDSEQPLFQDAEVVEDATLRARQVPGDPEAGVAAFLDGTQETRILAVVGPAPLIEGRTAAAIRVRRGRQLCVWGLPLKQERLYAPFPYIPRDVLVGYFGASLVDTAIPDADGDLPKPHPMTLLECAKRAISHDRDGLERRLAETWCSSESAPLYIDGGIGTTEVVARATCAIGVIKSHRTLYVENAALDTVLSLRAGQRSSVMRIAPRKIPVLSWYLRLRDTTGHDGLWGLVRVEVAEQSDVTARADRVSRWVMAEAKPLSAPDARWDKMAYGVRNTEEFLRAIM